MMARILNALRSPGAMMIALVLALVAQGEHTAQVFAHFAHNSNASALAYAFAAAVEVAVLLFVLKGHKYISYAFAIATFATNMVYYAIGGIDLLSVALFPVVLLSALLPGVIVGYSHTIAETPATVVVQSATQSTPRWQFWRKPLSATETGECAIEAPQTPVALPGVILGHPGETESASKADTAPVPPQPDKRTQAMQLHTEGYTATEIARMTDAKYSTVQSWLRRANAQTNGKASA